MFATLFIIYWGFLRLFLLLTVVFWVLFIVMFFVEHNTVLSMHSQEIQRMWNKAPLYTAYLLLLVAGGLFHFIGFFMELIKDSFQWVTGMDSRVEGHPSQ
ncbi:MAG: hypothetical protein NPIRA01_34150 [Nitrospirales bacterium]|nr:MAG: hypothetical protein NPIRA01_34150 [Nitrospirales bacterium]